MENSTNIGAIQKIEIAFSNDITISKPNSKNEVTVTNRAEWLPIKMAALSAEFTETPKTVKEGVMYEQLLKWKLPRQSPENHEAAYQFMNKKVIAKITDGNGTVILLGEPTRPLSITVSKQVPQKPDGFNGYQMTIITYNTHPAYYVA